MRIIYLIVLFSLYAVSCDSNYENIIDDPRIIGTWHRYSFTENGNEINESDSIIYHFLEDGRLIIKYFANQSSSQPDDNYEFDLQNGILRYWNSDYNVGEEKEITLTETTLRIKMYPSYYYNLSKLY